MKYSWFLLIVTILFCQIETVVHSLVSLAQKAAIGKLNKNVNQIECEVSRLPEELKTVVLHELVELYAEDIYNNQLKGIKPSNADEFKKSIQEKLSGFPVDFKQAVKSYFVLKYANYLACWQWNYAELPCGSRSICFRKIRKFYSIGVDKSVKDWRVYPFDELLEQVVNCIKSSPLPIIMKQPSK